LGKEGWRRTDELEEEEDEEEKEKKEASLFSTRRPQRPTKWERKVEVGGTGRCQLWPRKKEA
jgi:hypothetical protein